MLADPVVVAVAPPGDPCAVVVVDPFAVVVVVEVVVLAVVGAGGADFSVDLHPVNIEQVIMLPIAYEIITSLFVFIRLVLSLDFGGECRVRILPGRLLFSSQRLLRHGTLVQQVFAHSSSLTATPTISR